MQIKSATSVFNCWFFVFVVGLFIWPIKSQAAVVLQYHHISNSTPEVTSLSPELFAQHLEYLHKNNFNILNLETFIRHVEGAKPFPNKSVLITFDDGYRSIFDNAFPLLKKYNYPFTVFVNTQPLEQKLEQFMTWNELQAIIDYGGAVANHSVSHPHMIPQNQDHSSRSKIKVNQLEIEKAERALSINLSKYYKVFAYPYGEFDNQVKTLIGKQGYIAFGQHSGAVGENFDSLALPRFPFGGRYGRMEDFILKVNSQALEVKAAILLDENDHILESHLIPNTVKTLKLFLQPLKKHAHLVVTCFAPDGSPLKNKKHKNGLIYVLNDYSSFGRGRINCTAASEIPGSFYWFSQPLIKADADGNYY